MISFHWNELKYRLYYWLLNYILIFIIIWYYKQDILFNIINLNLIYTSLTEAFNSYIYFTIIFSFIFSIPILLYHIIIFIIPGLYIYECKNLLYNLIKYTLLFIIFYYTCFNYIFEFLINFFIEFEDNNLSLNLKIIDFINFLNNFIILFLIIFILPFININIKNKRKFIYLILTIFLALITPPDVLSLIISLIPLIILIEIKYLLELIKLNKLS